MLPNELTETKSASFALAWSITWRVLVIMFVLGTTYTFLPAEFTFKYMVLINSFNILLTGILTWAWIHRVLKLGIGNVKIIFMEKQHYEELVGNITDHQKL